MALVTLKINDVETSELKITVDIPPKIKGWFFADAIIRSKDEMKELSEKLEAGEFGDDEEAFLRSLYTGIRGLGDANNMPLEGEEAWKAVLKGKLSTYFSNSMVRAYFEHYGDALQKNLPRRRSR